MHKLFVRLVFGNKITWIPSDFVKLAHKQVVYVQGNRQIGLEKYYDGQITIFNYKEE